MAMGLFAGRARDEGEGGEDGDGRLFAKEKPTERERELMKAVTDDELTSA